MCYKNLSCIEVAGNNISLAVIKYQQELINPVR